MLNTLGIHHNDNVYIALKTDSSHIQGHKYASQDIPSGDFIIKYGQPIAHSTRDIHKDEHIHTHNARTNLGDILNYQYNPVSNLDTLKKEAATSSKLLCDKNKLNTTVHVYPRKNGEFGIRNELWVIPTVSCVNQLAVNIIDRFKDSMLSKNVHLKQLTNFDGVYTFTHPYGCSQMGDDHTNTKETLQNIIKHPNAGGVLVLGLGCENNQVESLFATIGTIDFQRVRQLVAQDYEDEIEKGVQLLTELYEQMSKDTRSPKPLSVLKVGLECGGSDGFSGITANPLVGKFSDFLIGQEGSTVLTEVPEMFGAEHLLMNRCANETVFNKTVDMINQFKNYYKAHNQVIYDNPSPGNKKGGITTLEDKSLGCTTKSGTTPIMDVLKHTERLKIKGLNLISAPGNDPVATTALGMSGCHMVLFTTGRGTPFGGFIPTVKIATNSQLARKKKNWIDFNAGRLLEDMSMDQLLVEFIDLIINIVNGSYTKQELNNFREIAIFKSGVTL